MGLGLIALGVLVQGVAATYALHALLLQERDSHEGPFKSKTRHVYFPESGHTQKVALFDWLRRPFGVYKVDGLVWTVTERSERWTCPFCLSWWVSAPFSLSFTLWALGWTTDALVWFVPIHCAIAVIAQLCHKGLFE